jgi:peptidoglycan/xylan/chitin deacetylase (PgdA/CDA1 family)
LGYEIVQWSDLSCDYDPHLVTEKSLNALTKNIKPGNIVVFHDSIKSKERLEYALPRVLEHFAAEGYSFDALHPQEMFETELVHQRA